MSSSESNLEPVPTTPGKTSVRKASPSAMSSRTASTKSNWVFAAVGTLASAARNRLIATGRSSGGAAWTTLRSTARISFEIRDRLPLPNRFSLQGFRSNFVPILGRGILGTESDCILDRQAGFR